LTKLCKLAAPEPATPMLDIARQAFRAALEAIDPNDLAEWGKANPNQFFTILLKLIPEGELGGKVVGEFSDTPLSDAEWTSRAGQ
jgi:hypothetical protein